MASSRTKADENYGIGDRVSLYVRLSSTLRSKIVDGEWKIGDQIPTVIQLSELYDVSKITVREAIKILTEEGLLEAGRGRGTFVIGKPQNAHINPIFEPQRQQKADKTLTIEVLDRVAVDTIPAMLGSQGKPDGDYMRIRKIHNHNGVPFCHATVYIEREMYKSLPRKADEKGRLTDLFRDTFVQRNVQYYQRVTISQADSELANTLKFPFFFPIGVVYREYASREGEILMASLVKYRGDSFMMELREDFAAMLKPESGWLPHPLSPS